jgi:hypothetical protein
MDGFPKSTMKRRFPKALDFFDNFEKDGLHLLSSRASYRRYQAKRNAPVYSCWNVGSYTFSPYKVAWAEMGTFRACVLSSIKTPYWDTPRLVIPDHKIYFVPMESSIEAHYLCAFLNAPQLEEVIKGYVENVQIGTHITEYIKIPKFDITNPVHKELADISQRAHVKKITPEQARNNIRLLLADLLNI